MSNLAIFVPTRLEELSANAGEHILSGSPQASAVKALLRIGVPLVGGNAQGTYEGINAPLSYLGDFVNRQVNGTTVYRVASSGQVAVGSVVTQIANALEIGNNANNTQVSSIRARNWNEGAAATVGVTLICGDTNSASGSLFAGSPNHSALSIADRFGLTASDDASGLTLSADAAGQDIRCFVGGLGEQLRLSTAGELLIGTMSALGRLAVVGRQDQIQQVVRAFSNQIQPVAVWQDSGGIPRVTVGSLTQVGDPTLKLRLISSQTGDYIQCRDAADSVNVFRVQSNGNMNFVTGSGTFLQITGTTAGINVMGGAAIAGVMTTLDVGAAGNVGVAIKGRSSQTGDLQRWTDNVPNTLAKVTAVGRIVGAAPNSAIADGDLHASSFSFYLNEVANQLVVKAKYADGTTIKTGTIALA